MNKVFFVLFACSFFFACKKPSTLSPNNDTRLVGISFVDTLSIKTFIHKTDSIATGEVKTSLLGIHKDSIFGVVSSGFAISPLLSSSNVNFGQSPTFDSLVLTLQNAGYYGKTSSDLIINVYELDETLDKTAYYSNYTPKYKSTPLFSRTVRLYRKDSLIVHPYTVKQAPHIRIKLDDDFGKRLLALSGEKELSNNTEFVKHLKGFYITAQQTVSNNSLSKGDGVIAYYNTSSGAMSEMRLYYNGKTTYKFLVNATSKNFNTFAHNYANTDIEQKLKNLTNNENLCYVQPLAGVGVKFIVPYIRALKKKLGNITINKAEVHFYADSTSFYPPAKELLFVKINENGKSLFIRDFSEGKTHYGGSYGNPDKKAYKFNITLELQEILNNPTRDSVFYLRPLSRSVEAYRSVLYTQRSAKNPAKIVIFYTRI